LSYEHVPVQSDQDIANICAHFYRFTQIVLNYNFVVLCDVGCVQRRAKQDVAIVVAAVHWVKYENQTINAIEFCV
jgi:hypothetical protein